MSDPDANRALQGKATDEAASLVHAQRELKKLEKQQRKLESQIKAAGKEGKDVSKLQEELADVVQQSAVLESVVGKPSASTESAGSAPAASSAAAASITVFEAAVGKTDDAADQPRPCVAMAAAPANSRVAATSNETLIARVRELELQVETLKRQALPSDVSPPLRSSETSPGLSSRPVPPRIQLDQLALERPPPQPTPLQTPAHSDVVSEHSRKQQQANRKRGTSHVNVFEPRSEDRQQQQQQAHLDQAINAPRSALSSGLGGSNTTTPRNTYSAAAAAAACAILQPVPNYRTSIYPRIGELGLLYQTFQIVGGNARTISLIEALIDISREIPLLDTGSFTTQVCTSYLSIIDQNCKFLQACREHCHGQLYVIRRLRMRLARNLGSTTDGTAGTPPTIETPSVSSPLSRAAPAAFSSRSGLLGSTTSTTRLDIDDLCCPATAGASGAPGETGSSTPAPQTYNVRDSVIGELEAIREEIFRAIHSIVDEKSPSLFTTRDVILVCGRSSTIESVLLRAAGRIPPLQHTPFHVIVIDCAPLFEGRDFAWRLQQAGVEITYGLISSICVHMPRCTKVFIGASAVLQSGEVHGRCGSALVAATAKRFRKPVLCFTESYKFISKVWIGSLMRNQDADSVSHRQLIDFSNDTIASRKPVSAVAKAVAGRGYLYDLCPADFIDMIVSEMGCLHPSAIAAAIRDREDREKALD